LTPEARPTQPVLVVEDDPDCREMLVALLEAYGYLVVTADNGALALRVARGEHPCLILLDLMMPIMDGEEFRNRQLSDPEIRDIPVVILSARFDARAVAARLGATRFLGKPLDFDQVAATVDEICALR
jgi:CheY-like chemotaxis protein